MKKFTLNHLLVFLILASFFAISFAYISQYFFKLSPCHLCVWQRYPFFAIIAISSLFLVIFKTIRAKKLAIFLSMFFLIINSAIALYHTGVEKKIFKIKESCISQLQENYNSVEELKIAFLNEKSVRCDNPSFLLLTLSMATWNFIYCLTLFFITLFLYLKLRKNEIFS